MAPPPDKGCDPKASAGKAGVNPPLNSARLHLVPMAERHAPELYSAIADPVLYTWIDQDPPASVAALRERCRRLECRHSPDGSEIWLNWVLYASDRRQPLGYVQASVLVDGRAWVAYLLEQRAWGQGYASEVMAVMLQHLFGSLGVRQAMAVVEQANARSIALLRRLGFTLAEGEALQGHELTATELLWVLEPADGQG